jgi:hypothetical protein
MSKFAPTNGDSTPLLKFGVLECPTDGPFTAKNDVVYYKVTVNITPFIDPENIPQDADAMKIRTWKLVTAKWNQEFSQVFFPSLEAQIIGGVIKSVDDVFSEIGQQVKSFYVSYQTPLLLVPANADDIQYAKDHDRLESLVLNSLGQAQKKRYPPKIVNLYGDRAIWESDALKNAAHAPAQSTEAQPAKTQSNVEYAAALSALPIFVASSQLDLMKLEASLQAPPLNIYFNMNSPEVKHAVAEAIVARYGQDLAAIKGVLIGMNNYLDIEGDEIQGQLSEIAF